MTFFTKHFYLSGICILGQLIFSSCSAPSNVERAIEEQVLHFGLGAEPQYLDPHLATSVAAHNILSALLEGLVSEDPKTLQPCSELLKVGKFLPIKKDIFFNCVKMLFGTMAIRLLPMISYIPTNGF